MKGGISRKQAEAAAAAPLVRIVSLGCPKNFVDTELAAGSLLLNGFGLTADENAAGMMFLNTCAFLRSARQEAETAIRSAEDWKKTCPGRKIIVAGCIVPWDVDGSFRKAHPAVDAWCPVSSAEEIGPIAKAVWRGQDFGGGELHTAAGVPSHLSTHTAPRLQLTPPHYAYLRIAEGCNNRCSYCRIPDIRGPLRSRTLKDVLAEARNLLAGGVKELIVIAQDTASFGRDRKNAPDLADLLRELDNLDGTYLLRLMYLHPAGMNDKLLSALASCSHLAPCLEMPLQHISTRILSAMHRRMDGPATRALVKTLKQELGFSLRTTFLTGFPGETEEEFEELKDFMRKSGFSRLGVFAFSREKGTPAATLPGQIPQKVARRRRRELMELQAGISLAANRALTGRTLDVILDEILPRGKALGRTFCDAPDIDNLVQVHGLEKNALPGDFIKLRVESASEYDIQGVQTPEISPDTFRARKGATAE